MPPVQHVLGRAAARHGVLWGLGGAAPLRGAQVWVSLTPAALPAVFHVTRLPELVSPCV